MRHCSFILVVLSLATAAQAAIPQSERDALTALYSATDGDHWTDHTNWLGAAGTECTWFGVSCNDAGTNVTSISLLENHLTGSIPASIGTFTALTYLDVSANALTGTIPAEIGNLTKIDELLLYENKFTGAIPPQLGNLTAMTFLSVESNQLTGTIPPELGNATALQILFLGGNQLTGAIPTALSRLTALQELDLSENQLSGSIPPELGLLSNLTQLHAGTNQLSGVIPPALGNLRQLDQLDLSTNALTGTIPMELTLLPKLTTLSLDRNQLSGPIPPQIGNLTSLVNLTLSTNALTGTMPPDLGRLTNLQLLDLSANQLTGAIPPQLASATSLQEITLYENQITGALPPELAKLSALQTLSVSQNLLGGAIPQEYAQLTNLQHLYLDQNEFSGAFPPVSAAKEMREIVIYQNAFSGPLPDWLGSLTKLEQLLVASNQFSGTIPLQIGQLTNLMYFIADANQLTGTIPTGLANLTALNALQLSSNSLSGTIPPLGALKNLATLSLEDNQLEGNIPRDLGNLTALQELRLGINRLSGSIPAEIGALTNLTVFTVGLNALTGTIPPQITNLTKLTQYSLDVSYNSLTTDDAAVRAFVNDKQGGDFEATQTLPPTAVTITDLTDRSAVVNWTPIKYQDDDGGYQVTVTNGSGNVAAVTMTTDKYASTTIVRGLAPATPYAFTMRTITNPHSYQQNVLTSTASAPVSATTGAAVTAPADVELAAQPSGLVQVGGVPQNQDSFILTNFGDLAANVTVAPNQPFFTLAPTAFTLNGGSSQVVTITSVPQPPNSYYGDVAVTVNGEGVDLGIVVQLLSVDKPSGTVVAQPLATRVESSGDPNTNTTVTIRYRNGGTATLTGIVLADAPWISAPTSLVTINPGDVGAINCTIVRAKRPDAGTLEASVRLIYLDGSAPASLQSIGPHDTPPNGLSVSIVTVVDTTKPSVSSGSIPAIVPPEIGRFVAGAATGVTKLSIANAFGVGNVSDLRMYFMPIGGTSASVATFGGIAPSQSLVVANVVDVYGTSAPRGTLQIRSARIGDLQMSAIDASQGRPGALPVFRSDRSLAAGQSLVLTGVVKSGSVHTSITIQETAGRAATARVAFLDASGAAVGSPRAPDAIGAFGLLVLADVVPPGAVTTVVANDGASSGRIAAYATVTDDTNGSHWSILDWSRFFAFAPNGGVAIPYAAGSGTGGGHHRPAKSTSVSTGTRTELVLHNAAATAATGTLRFCDASGSSATTSIALAPHETKTIADAVRTTGRSGVGVLAFEPAQGSAFVTARIVAPDATSTAVPVVAATSGIRLGQSKTFAGLDDAAASTASFGIVESGGGHVTVRATLTFVDGHSVYSTNVSRDFTLGPHQSTLASPLAAAILGNARSSFGDLHSVQLTLTVVDGDGAAVLFCIATDTATGSSIVRVE